jgi:tryptophan halogenase
MKILIVGGGSSGWLVASGLIRYFPNYDITLIESPTIPTIGVGESTTAFVKHFIKNCLKINEYDFLKKTNGIYKMSIKFKNFSKLKDNGYHYPFGMPYTENFNDFYIAAWDIVKNFNKNIKSEDFVKFMYPAYSLFSKNKINENLNEEFDNFNFNTDLGYHFDANKVGEYLKTNYCIPKGVNHIYNNVKSVVFLNEEIEYLVLENDEKIYADLFIDCSGFKSILLGQKIKPKFINISHKLINNKAWAVPIQYKDIKKQMQPYTTGTAIENGWCWYTPIASRIGNGYAYSDKFVNSEKALNEFKNYLYNSENYSLSKEEINQLPFFEINMKSGYYEESMVKNVVGIGMSSGFLEPLEGTGIHFIIEEIKALCKIIELGKPNQFLIDSFNLKIKNLYETWTDTLTFLYISSRRNDTEYWKHINTLKTINLNLKNQNHFHDVSDYGYRIFDWTHHNFVNDLFNHSLRGSSLVNNFNEFDVDIFSMYNNKFINLEKLSKEYFNIFIKNKRKWDINSNNSLHIYNFLLEKNAIR